MELGRTVRSRSARSCTGRRCSISLGAQPRCVVAMEACASAHEMGKLGHDVRLVPPINVMSFALGLKSWLFTSSDRSGGDAAKRTGRWRGNGRTGAPRPHGTLTRSTDDGSVALDWRVIQQGLGCRGRHQSSLGKVRRVELAKRLRPIRPTGRRWAPRALDDILSVGLHFPHDSLVEAVLGARARASFSGAS